MWEIQHKVSEWATVGTIPLHSEQRLNRADHDVLWQEKEKSLTSRTTLLQVSREHAGILIQCMQSYISHGRTAQFSTIETNVHSRHYSPSTIVTINSLIKHHQMFPHDWKTSTKKKNTFTCNDLTTIWANIFITNM